MGFLTKARQETGADKPKFGGGGNFVDIDAMVAREVVFGITKVEWDEENMWEGKPRPRWLLDIIPWYEGETLPGKADDNGRLTQLDVGRLSLASHQSRDDFMDQLQAALEDEQGKDPDYVEGPGILIRIRVPGGKGGRYTDLCEWDEENERPILSQGAERVKEEEEPRRPTGRSAPSRRGQSEAPATRGSSRRRAAEPEPEPERDEPAQEEAPRTRGGSRRRTTAAEEPAEPAASSGFAGAGGAESDGGQAAAVPAPAAGGIHAADLKLVSEVVGGDPYTSAAELAEEYDLPEGTPFPGTAKHGRKTYDGLKAWLVHHGILDFPEGRGRIKQEYRDAYSIALRAWMMETGRDANGQPGNDEVEQREHDEQLYGPEVNAPQDNASRTSPNPAVRSGELTPSGAEHVRQQRVVQPADVPDNAREADRRMRPADAPVRAEDKAAWMPPDQRERGPQPASEHVYQPGDVGDSVDPCPGCNSVVRGARALPMGGGTYGIMHECDGDGAVRPLRAHNIRKG